MSTTDHDDLSVLTTQVDRTSGSIFSGLIGWLRQLEARVDGHEERLARIEREIVALQAEVAALEGVGPDDDSGLAARLAAVEEQLAELTAAIQSLIPGPAAQLVITIDPGGPMPTGAISIDAAGKTASFSWKDDHGNPTPDAASADGGPFTVVLACDNPSVATLAADPSTPYTFDITPLAVGGAVESSPGSGQWSPDGSVHIVATATDDQGAAAVFADGQPVSATPADFGVFPGAAAELDIAVNS